LQADLALINANVHTMNPNMPTAEAVAIKDGVFIKVGANKQIKPFIGKKTKVIDLSGKTVLPGLIDTHVHVADFGRCLLWLDLTSAKSIGELQRLVKKKAKQTHAGKWVIGRGWNQSRFKENRMPTREDLDKAAPDNPVILYHEAAMICAVNSTALALAGVTEKTAVPAGGTIEKNQKTGKLTGILRDTAATLVWQAVPEPTAEELLDATARAAQEIAKAGITTVHWLVLAEYELELIRKLYAKGILPVRVNVVVPVGLLQKIGHTKSTDSLMLRFGGVMIDVDGYLDSKTAALFQPYSGEPNNCSKLNYSEQELAALVGQVLAAGFQPVLHAMGDKAVDTALKVIEKAPKDTGGRFHIEQAALLNEDLITRLKKQHVVVSVQPKVISTEFSVWSAKQRLGFERVRWLHPLKTLLDKGVKVAGGSDCPMEPLNPMIGIQELATRDSKQRISVLEALRMYTFDAAYCSCEEKVKGSIEEGKLADLTVLSSDPLAAKPEKIHGISVCMVVVNGKKLKS
jgi:predicted amidohydrolase YtcJ